MWLFNFPHTTCWRKWSFLHYIIFLPLLKIDWCVWVHFQTRYSFPLIHISGLTMQETWETWVNPWVGKILWSKKWQPAPVFVPGQFHGQRSLADYSPWGCKESDMIEQLNNNKYLILEGILENASKGVKNEADKGRLKGKGAGVFIHPSYQY